MKQSDKNPLRLRKKHGDGTPLEVSAADAERLLAQQSLRAAMTASLITLIVFSILWLLLSDVLGRVFPWFTVVLGYLVGHAVRRAGRGVSWPFPVVAALLAGLGSVFAKIVVAASVSADELGIGTLEVLQSVTAMTWPVFFAEAWSIGDTVFALAAAAVAAFFAPRRLSRGQYFALRQWREGQAQD